MLKVEKDGLAVYKGLPVKVCDVGKKIEIELQKGIKKSVREKDIEFIHPGPVKNADIDLIDCDLEETWSLLQGESVTLSELAEFLYGDSSAPTVFNAYIVLKEGLYFSGTLSNIQCNTRESIDNTLNKEKEKEAKALEIAQSMERLSKGKWNDSDVNALREIEAVALEEKSQSKILKKLGVKETTLDAHRFLIKIGYWNINRNPYPGRFAVTLKSSVKKEEFPEVVNELDLTHLNSYAIDDEGSNDPDDAISLDGDKKVWVHITDVASIIKPGSPSDLDASGRGSNLYLPTQTVHMLPEEVTEIQGLGIREVNNALSFMFEFDTDFNITNREIHLSRISVKRLSYNEVDERKNDTEFKKLFNISQKLKERRDKAGAISIDLPEVKIRVNDKGNIDIKQIKGLESRSVISEYMLLAGESAAIFCSDNNIPIPYATQLPPDAKGKPDSDLASMFVWRRKFKRGEVKYSPEPHAGLGLLRYTRATSPLRRYSDLVVNQQIRAYLRGEELLSEEDILLKVSPSLESMRVLGQCERASNLHWKLVYLKENSSKIFDATYVEKKDKNSGIFLIEDLALETTINTKTDLELNKHYSVSVKKIDIPACQVTFSLC